jgi:tryptophan synthase alpha chain
VTDLPGPAREHVTESGVARLHDAVERGRRRYGIALMSHAVVGYPSPEECTRSVDALCAAGVELMELQFPFSDPIADGPVLTHANQAAVKNGITTREAMRFARATVARHPETAFVIMTYLNVIVRFGQEAFVRDAAEAGIAALIVPDLPPEEADAIRELCDSYGVGTVFLVAPATSPDRAAKIAEISSGFVYCVGRTGVSGEATVFDEMTLAPIRAAKLMSKVPVGVGFGIRHPADVEALMDSADIAIVCTEAIRRLDEEGVDAAAAHIGALRDSLAAR